MGQWLSSQITPKMLGKDSDPIQYGQFSEKNKQGIPLTSEEEKMLRNLESPAAPKGDKLICATFQA